MFGYTGKVLWVDLTTGSIKEEALEEKFCRDYIGGYGFGARVLYDRMKAGVDPLGPENILGFASGVLAGTPMFSGSRYTVFGKSPLTGGWGDANSGGSFGPHLRFSGFEAVYFTGQSVKPVYLLIDSGKAELRDASHLWGKDSNETEDILRKELGKDTEVACIGPSGEKLALISCVINNKGRAAGRSGLGAVMGSKKLKAIAVKGNLKIPMYDENLARELRKKYLPALGGPVDMLKESGTATLAAGSALKGDSPVKNWGGVGVVDFPDVSFLDINLIMSKVNKKYACYRCPVGCGGEMKANSGEYAYEAGAHKPEYETLAMFGSNCLNTNLDSIILANHICNLYGLDTISAGATIAFAIECYENGLITRADTDGIEMTWGNHRSIITMLERLAKREGFGDILADGVKVAAQRIGKGAEKYAMHINGQELPAHDPKLGLAWGITYRADATPARHTQGPQLPPPGVMPKFDPKSMYGRGKAHKVGAVYTHILNCTGMCSMHFGGLPSADVIAEFMQAITGWDVTLEELQKTGERIGNVRQVFNIREGINLMEYQIPGRITGNPPLSAGPTAGVTLDEKTMVTEFLTEMGWDVNTAKPSREKLIELGLDDMARDLWG